MIRFLLSIAAVLLVVLAKSIQPDNWSDGDVCTTGRCRCEEFRVNCSGTNITSDTLTGVPNYTQLLNLSNTDFGAIKDSQFVHLNNLTVLDLSNASLTKISRHAFNGLEKLRYLNISQNENYPLTDNTTENHPDLFANLTSLVELKMFGTTTANLPYSYPNALLSRLTSLQELWIDGIDNKTLGAELSALTQLRVLRFPGDQVGFGFCDIDHLQDGMFDSVTGITSLHIIRCGVQILGINVFSKLKKLEYLDLSDNVCLEIDAVSNALGKLTNSHLTTLVLNHIYYTRQKTCGTVIDKEQVIGMKDHNITTLLLEDNAIVKIHQRALEIFPKTLRNISVRNNEFEMNTYLFYVRYLLNLEYLDASYQFSPNMLWSQYDPKPGVNAISRNKNNCRRRPTQTHPANTRNTRDIRSATHLRVAGENRKSYETKSNTAATITHNHISEKKPVCPQPPHKIPPIIPFLPPKMNYVDLSHCRINLPIFNITLDSNNSVRMVDASSSMLTCWEGPVYGLYHLEYLDLSNNLCTRVGPNFFSEFTNLRTLILSQNPFGVNSFDVAGGLFRNLTNLEVLVMENNSILNLPPTFLASQNNLRHLNLRGNLLTEFYVNVRHMNRLTLLDLRYNSIAYITTRVRAQIEAVAASVHKQGIGPLKIDLSSNLLHCYCINLKFLKWLLQGLEGNPRLNVKLTTCRYEAGAHENITDAKQLGVVIAKLEKECASKLPLIIGLTTGIVLLTNIIVGFTVHYYRWKLRYWWYVSTTGRKARSKGGYRELQTFSGGQCGRWKYDVYVACAEEEKEAEFVKDMLEYLENRNDMRVCVPDRDFVPGQNEYGMIANAIHVSRVSIIAVTEKSSIDSKWEIAMRMSQEESLSRGKRMQIGIFLDDIPQCLSQKKIGQYLCDLVKAKAYLEYPNCEQSDAVIGFWNKCADLIKQGEYQQEDWSEVQ